MNEVKSTCLHNSLLLVNPAVGRSVDFLGRSCGSIIKTHPDTWRQEPEQGASQSPVNDSLPEQSPRQVLGRMAGEGLGEHMEQGDFVPISKNLTTQLGRTDGNNYNKEEKEI